MSSNRETRELYAHLTVPTDDQLARDIVKIVADALDDVRREPKLWSDSERNLRTGLRCGLAVRCRECVCTDAEVRSRKARHRVLEHSQMGGAARRYGCDMDPLSEG